MMSNEFKNLIKSIHGSLGVPEDYQNEYGLTLQYEEIDLIEIENDIYGRPQIAARIIAEPWFQMKAQAENEGVLLNIVSAFRSVDRQKEIIQRKIDNGGRIEEILKVCAAPGYSEHHSGRAFDLTTHGCEPLTEDFDKTDAFKWLQGNAHLFSFRLSYPKGNKYGIAYEPWHWALRES
jgi:D-alanyl-D-alanine carboxypeptidase